MNIAISPTLHKRRPWGAWILRLTIGAVLIGVSVWGVALCREIFRSSVGPGSVPGDSGFASLATWAAWALFFAPLAIGGMALVWSALRKMGAFDLFAFWLQGHVGEPEGLVANATQFGGIVRGGSPDDPHGLESLSGETVERLHRTAARTAIILGGLTGALLLGVGFFGLGYLLVSSWADASNAIYGHLAVGRALIAFALFSGMLVLAGLTILQQTFRRDNGIWLLPLRIFTHMILRRRAGERSKLVGQRQPTTKQLPKV